MGNPLDTVDTMRGSMEKAGFIIQGEVDKKYPYGTWPKNPLYKEIGRVWASPSYILRL